MATMEKRGDEAVGEKKVWTRLSTSRRKKEKKLKKTPQIKNKNGQKKRGKQPRPGPADRKKGMGEIQNIIRRREGVPKTIPIKPLRPRTRRNYGGQVKARCY